MKLHAMAMSAGFALCAAMAAECVAASPLDELMPVPKRIVRAEGKVTPAMLECVKITTGDVEGAPAGVACEAYEIALTREGAVIKAPSEKGKRYALVTLNQLKALMGGAEVEACTIRDWPTYRWRGFMPDTARNYLDMDSLKAVIDMMGRYKLNLLHWHLSENYAWRLESKKYPQLKAEKAFIIRHVGKYYTQDDFREIVRYSAERGVTVMPELDVPGHAQAFRTAFGFERMTDGNAGQIIADLFDELCTLATPEEMPFVHVGGDEVWKREMEGVSPETLKLWAETLARNKRALVNWIPGEPFPTVGPRVSMMWAGKEPADDGSAIFDANGMYIETLDPFEILTVSVFRRTCKWDIPAERKQGVIFCAWHDGFVGDNYADMLRNQQIMPSCVLFGNSFWNGCAADRPDRISRMPFPSEKDFSLAVDVERRTVAQRDKALKGLDRPFHFLKQSDMRWRLTDGKGGLIAKDIASASISPFKAPYSKCNFITNSTGLAVMETWIKSPKTQKVGAWIGFTNIDRDHGLKRARPLPKLGEWTRFGSKIELNGEEIPPPHWKRPGLDLGKQYPDFKAWALYEIDEEPYTDQEYFMREPTQITLREGWNHVKLTLPMTTPVRGWSSHQWIGTFIPLLGTTDHPVEVPDLEYSSNPPPAK